GGRAAGADGPGPSRAAARARALPRAEAAPGPGACAGPRPVRADPRRAGVGPGSRVPPASAARGALARGRGDDGAGLQPHPQRARGDGRSRGVHGCRAGGRGCAHARPGRSAAALADRLAAAGGAGRSAVTARGATRGGARPGAHLLRARRGDRAPAGRGHGLAPAHRPHRSARPRDRLRPGDGAARGRLSRLGRRPPRRSPVMSTPPNGPGTGTPDATAPSTGPSAEPSTIPPTDPSTIPPTDPSANPPVGRSRPRGGTLALRPRGLWLVTSLELRQRIRSARWYVALGIWTLLLFGIGVLSLAPALYTTEWGVVREVARVMFSLQMILVLLAMLLVTPALSAGSINGDR